MFIQESLKLILIPALIDFFSFHDKGWISSNPVPKRFIDPKKGLDIDEFDEKTMFIESGQFSDQVG